MKKLKLFYLYSYKFKYVGLIIGILSILSLIVLSIYYKDEKAISLLEWFGLLGLFIISVSKEKNENDNTHKVRYFTLQSTFIFSLSLLMAYEFTIIVSSLHYETNNTLICFIILSFYIVVFYTSLFFSKKKTLDLAKNQH